MTTGERIRIRRKELGISADTLADALGVSRSTIFRYENGHIEKFPMDKLEPVAKILNTSVEYLMGWIDENNKPVAIVGNELVDKLVHIMSTLSPEKQREVVRFAGYVQGNKVQE